MSPSFAICDAPDAQSTSQQIAGDQPFAFAALASDRWFAERKQQGFLQLCRLFVAERADFRFARSKGNHPEQSKVANISSPQLRNEKPGIALGWCATLDRARLGEAMLAFAQRHGDVDLGVHEMSPAGLLAALRRDELDLIILPGAPRIGFASHMLWHEPMRIAMGLGHPLAAKPVVTDSDLSEVLLLITQDDRHGAAHRLLVEHIGPSLKLKTSMRPAGPERLEAEIAAGEGAVLFCGDWTGKHRDIVVKPLAPPHDQITFRAIWNVQSPHWGVLEFVSIMATTKPTEF